MMIASRAAIVALVCLLVGGAAILYGPDIWRGEPGAAMKPGVMSAAPAATGPAVTAATTPSAAPAATSPAAPRGAQVASATPEVPAAAPSKPDNALVGALGEARSVLADLPSVPAKPADDKGPRFDVARVDDDGEAVIAGRAAPGARVELLRDGEKHDVAVADASGQFVMTPPRLPPGNYKLTLKSTAPDGAVAQSSADVPVALNAPARAAVATATRPAAQAAGARDAARESPARDDGPTGTLALAAAPPAEKGPLRSKADVASAIASSRIVTRGDSLWMISRRTYGDGAAYALIYNANRDKIHDPDRIYPGQTFVLPRKVR